jgi:hypothetical protein
MSHSDYSTNLDLAHKHSSAHREEILKSELCACFYCCQTFLPHVIEDWVDENTTALCPKGGIDAVIGSASEFPLTPEFLQLMHRRWFS